MTAAVGRCVHEMLPGQCSWCQGLDERLLVAKKEFTGQRARQLEASPGPERRHTALFTSRCPNCDYLIKPGDTLVLTDADEWVCELFCGEGG